MRTRTAYFDRFTLRLTLADANTGSHQGQCDDDIEALIRHRAYIAKQLAALKPEDVRAELAEYGAWDESELADNAENQRRILWIACGNVREEAKA